MNFRGDAPAWLHNACAGQHREVSPLARKHVSVTRLIEPAHKVRLENDHRDELEADVYDYLPALLGTAWHAYIAHHMPESGWVETKLAADVNGWMVEGTPDFFNADTLIDHKLQKCWSKVYGKPEHEKQLNCYRWLVHRVHGITLDRLEVHAVYTDWTPTAAARNTDFPRKRLEVVPIRTWSLEETQSYIEEQLYQLELEVPPLCNPVERWERGECWAIRKPGRKSALRIAHSEDEALRLCEQAGSQAYVEHRPGQPIRCQSYCGVARWCSFGKEYLDDG